MTRIEDSAGIVQWVSISPDRRLLLAAGADGTLRLWNVADSTRPVLIATLAQADSKHPLYAAAFSPDGTLIAAAGAERVVRLWRITSGGGAAAQRHQAAAHRPERHDLLRRVQPGRQVARRGQRGRQRAAVAHRRPRGARRRQKVSVPGTRAVNAVAFGAGGQVIAAGTSAGTVMLWRLRQSAAPVPYPHMPLTGPGGLVSGIAFSPDGHTLAASSHDDKVWLWTVRTTKKSGTAVPDGSRPGQELGEHRRVQPGRQVDRGRDVSGERTRVEPGDAGAHRDRAAAAARNVGRMGRRAPRRRLRRERDDRPGQAADAGACHRQQQRRLQPGRRDARRRRHQRAAVEHRPRGRCSRRLRCRRRCT